MRCFLTFLSLSALLLAGCKKPAPKPEPEVAAATPTPEPTPVPTPEPTPTPIDLNAQVLVFCYHRFEDRPKDSLAIKPAEFEAQMQAIKDAGIEVISMEDFLAWRRGEKSIPPKSAVISIDDGYISGYNVAWPVLKKFGYPFTMFVYTDYIRGGARSGGQSMSWEQLAEMRDAGVDIQSHTVSHSALNAKKGKTEEQYREWLTNELAGSKKILEDKLGIQVKALAYPYGLHNETVRAVAKEAGYEAAFTVYGQRIAHGSDPTMVGRYAIESTKPKVFEQAIAFHGPVSGSVDGATAMPAAATMVTQPMEGETVSDPSPEIKANLATLGKIDPKSVTMRLSGLGLVPATYDDASKTLSYKISQKLYARQVTVIVSAVANGRKVETRWTFSIAPAPATENTPAAASPSAPPQ